MTYLSPMRARLFSDGIDNDAPLLTDERQFSIAALGGCPQVVQPSHE